MKRKEEGKKRRKKKSRKESKEKIIPGAEWDMATLKFCHFVKLVEVS